MTIAARSNSLFNLPESSAIGDVQAMPLGDAAQAYVDEATRTDIPSTLLSATEVGPFVNIGRFRSGAWIAAKNEILHLVSIPEATPRAVQSLSERLMMHIRNRHEREISTIFKELWEIIVGPIVDVLQDKLALLRKSRIWWCTSPAASRLPLHAAGNYSRKDQNLFAFSTYTLLHIRPR
ncbi:hypothetical protein FRB99_006811 [Tulasnella sp. 403]|nr:hypothetical protein FRB99_006811 [Tulasnella sp. 403]